MLLREKHILLDTFKFFLLLLTAFAILLFILQIFWTIADARHTRVFLWKDCVVNFYDSFLVVIPFITILSAFLVFSEMEKFKQISIFELKGISELQIFKIFVIFGFLCSLFSFIAGLLTPYQNEIKNNSRKTDSLSILTESVCFWATDYKQQDIVENLIISENRSNVTYYAKKAKFFEKSIILYDGKIVYGDRTTRHFQQFTLETDFCPRALLLYAVGFPERWTFFKLHGLLKQVASVGIKSKSDWIFLYSKISYPMLNIFIILLLFPFFHYRRSMAKTRIFSVAFTGTLMVYSLYSFGLSLGRAEIIPWQVAPWVSHLILTIFFILYLSAVRKKMYNFI
ncbi:MAG TPA: LptF/LptG family permease [bacterium]|nr:LptF/LptG family permease [bacterium]HOL48958.1 LptF/LptG family permease [bacterium]HPO51207.1 LptF/LptG family permease [bacterium]